MGSSLVRQVFPGRSFDSATHGLLHYQAARLRHAGQRVALFVRAQASRTDERALVRRLPQLADISISASHEARRLFPAREDYIRRVSTDAMAASLEACSLLVALCKRLDARRVADLGSGFSSYALRDLSQRQSSTMDVWSVDDDPQWLECTRHYLSIHNLPTSNLITWKDFATDPALRGSLDVVLHDLGHFSSQDGIQPPRAETVGTVLDLTRPGGLAVFDDAHRRPYRDLLAAELRRRNLRRYSLVRQSRGRFGRYAWVVVV